MNRRKVRQRLLWKDALTARPLLIAIVIGIALLHLVIWLFNGNTSDRYTAFVIVWFLMPSLMALGAPALLVGSEEELGTLEWLRTLPVRWQTIASSKLAVAAAGLSAAWLASSAALAISMFAMGGTEQIDVWSSMNANNLSWAGFASLFWFSVVLLLCGFVTAYRFRSPITALIVVVPIVATIVGVFNAFGNSLAHSYQGHLLPLDRIGSVAATTVCVVAMMVVLVLWWIQRTFAYRRLAKAAESRTNPSSNVASTVAYRPPSSGALQRPSVSRALLWQQWRQVSVAGGLLVLLAATFLLLTVLEHRYGDRKVIGMAAAFALLVAPSVFLWIGGLSFYGDSVGRRYQFFADRGISRTAVWWTRVLPPFLIATVVWVLVAIALLLEVKVLEIEAIRFAAGPLAGLLALFAIGQFVSQWTVRPALAFFASPMIATLCMLLLSFVFIRVYPTYAPTIGLVLPVLLFASWRLTPRWLNERRNAGYHLRVVAYLLLSLGIPLAFTLFHRYATIPPSLSQWRSEMLTLTLPRPPIESPGDASAADDTILPGARNAVWDYHNEPWDPDLQKRLNQELQESDPLGTHVSFEDIGRVFGLMSGRSELAKVQGELQIVRSEPARPASSDPAVQQLWRSAIEVLLSWSRRSREQLSESRYDLNVLFDTAERSDALAFTELAKVKTEYGVPLGEDASDLIGKIPTDELRRKSRRVAFLDAWQQFHHSESRDPFSGTYKFFGRYPILPNDASRVSIERIRSDRLIDYAVRELLEQVARDRVFADPSELEDWQELWREAQHGPRWPLLREHESALVGQIQQMAISDALLQQLRTANAAEPDSDLADPVPPVEPPR